MIGLKQLLRPILATVLRLLHKWRRAVLWMKRLDSLGTAALVLGKGPMYEKELTLNQLNGALFLSNEGLLYKEADMAGGDLWRATSRSQLRRWYYEEASRLGINPNSYEPKRVDPPGTTVINVLDQAPR